MANTCIGPGCDRPQRASRNPPLCSRHYNQRRRGKPLTALRELQRDLVCNGPECDRPARSGGLCHTHNDQLRKSGEMFPIGSRLGKRTHHCHEPGCATLTSFLYCDEHRPARNGQCQAHGCEAVSTAVSPYCDYHVRHDRALRHSYGISLRQRDTLAEAQGWACAICRRADRPLHVDHCHDTRRVRGLLCGSCNRGIGLFGHDQQMLLGAAEYVCE